MLSLNLTPIFNARGIERPYSFLIKAGLNAHTANLLLDDASRTIKLKHIELLCQVLICEPNDLLVFSQDKDQVLSPDHPLQKLKQTDISQNWSKTLATMPYQQLKEMAKQITQSNKPEQ